jgi:prepilin-type N-terminal cleavage/methylation domain-containing protein
VRRSVAEQSGFTLIEMLAAMMILTIAVSALIMVFLAAGLSVHRSAQRGTAVAVAEAQLEVYRTVKFADIRLNSSLIPTASTDTYVSGHSSDSNIPLSTNQAVGGDANNDHACPDTSYPAACLPVQTVTGADGRTYTLQTYIDYVNSDSTLSATSPASGLTLKRVTVVVRDPATNGILTEDSSAFQSS